MAIWFPEVCYRSRCWLACIWKAYLCCSCALWPYMSSSLLSSLCIYNKCFFLSSHARHPYSWRQADSCQHEGHRYDAQRYPGMEETRLWWQQGLVWKKDSTFYPRAKRESSHLQAERAAHSGVTSTDMYIRDVPIKFFVPPIQVIENWVFADTESWSNTCIFLSKLWST